MDTLQRYEEERRKVDEQIKQIRSGFPFNAVETMKDSAKTEDYLAELRVRKKRSEEEIAALEKQINQMMEGQDPGTELHLFRDPDNESAFLLRKFTGSGSRTGVCQHSVSSHCFQTV